MERRFLVCSAGGRSYALDLREVAEVQERPSLYPIPRVPPHLLGVMKFHGTLTAVLDLSLYCGAAGVNGGKVLVIDTRTAALALVVEEVGSVISEGSLLSISPGVLPIASSQLETAQGELTLLNLPALLALLEEELRL